MKTLMGHEVDKSLLKSYFMESCVLLREICKFLDPLNTTARKIVEKNQKASKNFHINLKQPTNHSKLYQITHDMINATLNLAIITT